MVCISKKPTNEWLIANKDLSIVEVARRYNCTQYRVRLWHKQAAESIGVSHAKLFGKRPRRKQVPHDKLIEWAGQSFAATAKQLGTSTQFVVSQYRKLYAETGLYRLSDQTLVQTNYKPPLDGDARHKCNTCRRVLQDSYSMRCPKWDTREGIESIDVTYIDKYNHNTIAQHSQIVLACPMYLADRQDGQSRKEYEAELKERGIK